MQMTALVSLIAAVTTFPMKRATRHLGTQRSFGFACLGLANHLLGLALRVHVPALQGLQVLLPIAIVTTGICLGWVLMTQVPWSLIGIYAYFQSI